MADSTNTPLGPSRRLSHWVRADLTWRAVIVSGGRGRRLSQACRRPGGI